MVVDVSDLVKADVLVALFCASAQQGMGLLDPIGKSGMSRMHAQEYLDDGQTCFDYLRGRVLKVDLSGDSFCPRLYDRDNGEGAAARAIEMLRDRNGRGN